MSASIDPSVGPRIGVVGLGFMGRRYVNLLHRLPEATVAAVCDVRSELAEEVAEEVGARPFGDASAMAQWEGVDAVCVCTPEEYHVEAAVAALAAGKALMIEKPVAHTLEAANQIVEAAKQVSTPVLVGHLLRFEPRWVAAKRALDGGDVGEIVSLHTRRVGNLLDQTVLKGRTSIPLYYGVHDLDILRWFAGAEATTIYAAKRSGVLRQAGYDTDDLYCATVQFANGILATAEIGWHVPEAAVAAPTAGVTVVGTRGWLRIEQKEAGLEIYNDGSRMTVHPTFDVTFWAEAHGIPGGALANELRHFAACAAGRAQPVMTLHDAVEALRLSLAMEASAERGQAIAVADMA